ncbi:6,7-dimethyl-8-ribityllumazine synthase [Golovinomyces cichoracearum]|uniref:6,7-dimethyl-8-ribityllumazine synthase n=1 Tax=Golovinomyces cichoracearum TaxID=62708 RepID=A0A420IEC3_9PEZI|nr:6,7-dimethyl-8-ribityllumazine synthase [Golovinomyces cichoracearum]
MTKSTTTGTSSIKGPGQVPVLDGRSLRIAIVHARWNMSIIEPLVAGSKSSLLAAGVKESNIIIHSVPGSWELPIACSRIINQSAPDAVIAIGVLIKGETMHFEYIANAVSKGLMRVQLGLNVPVIFGVLTVLSEEQAKSRAGIIAGSHNHGQDWGNAAVELGMGYVSKIWMTD